jgi:hypothetical protein
LPLKRSRVGCRHCKFLQDSVFVSANLAHVLKRPHRHERCDRSNGRVLPKSNVRSHRSCRAIIAGSAWRQRR